MSDQNVQGPSTQDPAKPAAKPAGKPEQSPVRIVVTVLLIAFIVGMGLFILNKYAVNRRYNQAVEQFNNDEYLEAAAIFEDVMPSLPEDARQDCKRNLTTCYVMLARDPKLPQDKTLEYLLKVNDLDPNRLNQQERRLVETAIGKKTSTPKPDEDKPDATKPE